MNEQNSRHESLRMFYKTRKGKKLLRFKKIRKICTIATAVVMAISIIATAALGAVMLLGNWNPLGGNEHLGTESETNSELEQIQYNDHEGVSYILVVGIDNKDQYGTEAAMGIEGYHSDVIAIACINHVTKEVNVMQIPRDLFIGTDIYSMKINAVYALPRHGENSINALRRRLASHLGIKIDHYIIFTIQGFMNCIDALNGIDIYIHQPNGLYIPHYITYEYYKIGPGWVHLDGPTAASFVRKRTGTREEGYVLGDPDRLEAQRIMYVAFAKRLMSMSATDIVSAVNACKDHVATSMTIDDIVGYGLEVKNMDLSKISVWGMPGQQGSYQHHNIGYPLSYYSIHKQEYIDMWNEHMNPFGEKLTMDSIKIRELHTELGWKYEPSYFTQGGSLSDIAEQFGQNTEK